MNKHIVNNWWKYIALAIVGLLAYYYLHPMLEVQEVKEKPLQVNTVQSDSPVEVADNANTVETPITIDQDNNNNMDEYTTTASGLKYRIISEGPGGPKPTDESQVEVHYHGTLTDGTVFDSSRERGETITFGLRQVIPGWTEGLQLMSVGDVYEFYIPAELAYGDRSPSPLIPAGSDLVFEVELFNIVN